MILFVYVGDNGGEGSNDCDDNDGELMKMCTRNKTKIKLSK